MMYPEKQNEQPHQPHPNSKPKDSEASASAMQTIHAETWGDQIRAYEREKRYVVDAGFVSGQPLRLQPGMFQAQEWTNIRIGKAW